MAFATASRQIGNAFPPPVAYPWLARRTRPPDQGQSQYGQVRSTAASRRAKYLSHNGPIYFDTARNSAALNTVMSAASK
jgi:hypothetical protein